MHGVATDLIGWGNLLNKEIEMTFKGWKGHEEKGTQLPAQTNLKVSESLAKAYSGSKVKRRKKQIIIKTSSMA